MRPKLIPLACTMLLVACAAAPPEPVDPPAQRSPEDVKLTLNLPEEPENCACQTLEENDRTFLERGMETLADGEYIEAVQYFQRYQRLEQLPLAQWEGDLAIAYVSMLPSSPFYDVDAALLAYTDLQSREPAGQKHHSIVIMQQALESFVLMERHIWDLENRTGMLQEDLDKREQALKRLRELTLGQPED
ncbi:hypothetical protein [Congregibacter sp.]|uniref:hypothetical protein n=1 Tax=Congregibacter sp. TaxID=2744308 RepID=UPI003F6D4210